MVIIARAGSALAADQINRDPLGGILYTANIPTALYRGILRPPPVRNTRRCSIVIDTRTVCRSDMT